jgi:hypothetical protein
MQLGLENYTFLDQYTAVVALIRAVYFSYLKEFDQDGRTQAAIDRFRSEVWDRGHPVGTGQLVSLPRSTARL